VQGRQQVKQVSKVLADATPWSFSTSLRHIRWFLVKLWGVNHNFARQHVKSPHSGQMQTFSSRNNVHARLHSSPIKEFIKGLSDVMMWCNTIFELVYGGPNTVVEYRVSSSTKYRRLSWFKNAVLHPNPIDRATWIAGNHHLYARSGQFIWHKLRAFCHAAVASVTS